MYPVAALTVFPWQGSHDHITFKPSFLIALINLGKCFETLSWPNLEIRVILPFSFLGLILLHKLINSSAFKVGPHLIPIGFSIPLQKLAYYSALKKGFDIDKPRNLAKSVTVE